MIHHLHLPLLHFLLPYHLIINHDDLAIVLVHRFIVLVFHIDGGLAFLSDAHSYDDSHYHITDHEHLHPLPLLQKSHLPSWPD